MAVIVHRVDKNNPGDFWSNPSHYFPIKVSKTIDIGSLNNVNESEPVIFGGGGLLGRITWDDNVSQLVENNKVILWGAGQNYYGQKKKGDLIGVTVESKLPDYINKFESIGLRDYKLGYNWVPCASCMHPALNAARKIKPTKNLLGIQHNKIKIKSPHFQSISHAIDPNKLQDFLCYIASFECIVTNTYHGAYWSLLLGKKVVIQPWSSKFNNLKWNVATTDRQGPQNRSIIDIANNIESNNQFALDEAILANNNFYRNLNL